MTPPLGRVLAVIVAIVAILNTVAALSMPVAGQAPHLPRVLTWLILLLGHASLYGFGERFRRRFSPLAYVLAQAAVLFAIAVSRPPMPMTLALFVAATAESVIVAGPRWGATRVTVSSIALLVLALLVTSGLYFAVTAGLVLALTGAVAHAVAAFVTQRAVLSTEENPKLQENAPPFVVDTRGSNGGFGLSTREVEVLRELVRGARNTEIAATLGITDRTVKSHLKSIYQKMGVESRTAAVARALQDKII
jgi:DNA-binding CsgD family transcriptional regulator